MKYEIIGGTRYAIPPPNPACPHCGKVGYTTWTRAVLHPTLGDCTISCMYYYERNPERVNPASPSHPARVQHFCYTCVECWYCWWEEDPGVLSNLRKDHKQQRENLRREQAFQIRMATTPGQGTGQSRKL